MELKGIDKIYVISLDRRKDRWFEFFRKSKQAGITNYEKWSASDGTTMVYDDDVKYLFRDKIETYGRGIIGCAMSHYRLWRHCIDNDIDNVLVFEDDVFFPQKENTVEIWNNIVYPCIQKTKEDLHFMFPSSPYLCGIVHGESKQVDGRLYLANSILERTFGYVITLKGMNKLIDIIDKRGINAPIDRFLQSSRSKIPVHVCKVKLFVSPVYYKTDIQHDKQPIKLKNS